MVRVTPVWVVLCFRAALRADVVGWRWPLEAFPWGKVPPKEADEGKGVVTISIAFGGCFPSNVRFRFLSESA